MRRRRSPSGFANTSSVTLGGISCANGRDGAANRSAIVRATTRQARDITEDSIVPTSISREHTGVIPSGSLVVIPSGSEGSRVRYLWLTTSGAGNLRTRGQNVFLTPPCGRTGVRTIVLTPPAVW